MDNPLTPPQLVIINMPWPSHVLYVIRQFRIIPKNPVKGDLLSPKLLLESYPSFWELPQAPGKSRITFLPMKS